MPQPPVKKLVLVVDDDQAIRDMVGKALQAKGYDVLLAKDGLEGSEMLAKKPDLLDVVVEQVAAKLGLSDATKEAIRALPAGVQEAIYSLLMMNNGFICESANIENLDPEFADMPIVRERKDNVTLGAVLSNSFGFGGTNGCLIFKRYLG